MSHTLLHVNLPLEGDFDFIPIDREGTSSLERKSYFQKVIG